MITYRVAQQEDARRIAQLHAISWQQNYKGILKDHYLKYEVNQDRMQVWEKRLHSPGENQYIVLAFDDNIFCGFACTFADHDPQWGALMDNLHVFGDWKGKGIGAELMKRSASWVYEKNPDSAFYLWVLDKNKGASRFYQRMGGKIEESTLDEMPGGGKAYIHRFVWRNLKPLIQS
ncbi:MAG: GNAT family N-acetyltransferase [Bacteroidota bacterium]